MWQKLRVNTQEFFRSLFFFFFINIRSTFVRSDWDIDFCQIQNIIKKTIEYVVRLSKFVFFVIMIESMYEISKPFVVFSYGIGVC